MIWLLSVVLLGLMGWFLWRGRDETWRKFSHFWTGSGSKADQRSRSYVKSKVQNAALDPVTQKYIKTFEPAPREQSLQVFFNFNGHTFEAYELLQLPAGASWDQVQQRWTSLAEKTQNELVQKAYSVLKEKLHS